MHWIVTKICPGTPNTFSTRKQGISQPPRNPAPALRWEAQTWLLGPMSIGYACGFSGYNLGIIFMKCNRAPGEEVWQFLSVLEVCTGRRHCIFGELRKLITKDLVQKKYLKYRQVPNGNPPHYEVVWGPSVCLKPVR